MNILIVHNYYQVPGGEDTVVNNEKHLLEANEHNVVLYTRNNSEIKNISKLKKILLPFSAFFSMRTYFDVRQIIKENNIDVVHVHNSIVMRGGSWSQVPIKFSSILHCCFYLQMDQN